jgi:hypothetical protein
VTLPPVQLPPPARRPTRATALPASTCRYGALCLASSLCLLLAYEHSAVSSLLGFGLHHMSTSSVILHIMPCNQTSDELRMRYVRESMQPSYTMNILVVTIAIAEIHYYITKEAQVPRS